MNDKELWELISIISEGQDSEQRRKVEQYITDLQKEIDRLGKLFYERNEENIRLNNIIKEYKNANEYHQKIIHELETMKQPNQLHSENVKLRAENNRLNNIIKEVRKALEKSIEEYKLCDCYETAHALEIVKCALQELKGSDSNE